MSAPTCLTCEYGRITLHFSTDRCKHAQNTAGLHPTAMRNNETLCGQSGSLHLQRTTPDTDPMVVPKSAAQQPIEDTPLNA